MQRPALSWKRAMRRRISGMLKAIGRMRQIPRPLLAGEVDPHRRQEGQRQHRQGDVPVPAMPAAHLVAVQPDLLLGRFEALLDRPAPAGDPGQRLQAGGGWAEHDVVRHLVGLGELAAHQQPVVPWGLLQAEQPEPRPVVQTLALRSGPGTQAAPALQGFGRRQILGRHRPPGQRPQRRLDRQHMGSVVLLQPEAQPAV